MNSSFFFTVLVVLVLCINVSLVEAGPLDWIKKHIFGPKSKKQTSIDAIRGKNTSEIIGISGYPCETHHVTTKDGYILTHFRMPQPEGIAPRGTILLAHGILDSSDAWVLNAEDQAFAFLAYNQGYDVWLMNSRGNKYVKKHTHFTVDDDEFWRFSFDEMGQYDVKTTVQYILDNTEHNTMSYVCHSQGCTQFLASISRYHSDFLNTHINHFFALAPVVFGYHSKSFLLDHLAGNSVDQILPIIGMKEFLPDNAVFRGLLPVICNLPLISNKICSTVLQLLTGYDGSNFDKEREALYFTHFPAGTSSHNIIHWAQHFRNNEFDLFAYESAAKNVEVYGSTDIPSYDLKQLRLPANMYFGEQDDLCAKEDRDTLRTKVPEHVEMTEIPVFSHVDFVWGRECRQNVYEKIFVELNQKFPIDHEVDATTFSSFASLEEEAAPSSTFEHAVLITLVGAIVVVVSGVVVLASVVYQRRRSYTQLE